MTSENEQVDAEFINGDPAVELSSNRTAMSFQRTALSTDRTLMSVVRTSLSLISFGFTIYEAFRSLASKVDVPSDAPRRMGISLVSLGIAMLVLGLINHWQLTASLIERRRRLFALGIVHHTAPIRISTTSVVALLLLLLGVAAIARIAFHVGPL